MKRRSLLQSGALLTLGTRPAKPSAPSDRIRVAVIGCGGMGRSDLADFQKNSDVEIAAVCDVYQPNLQLALDAAGGKAPAYTDYRRILDRKDIDAVVVATPDHWHALMTVEACDAGKDVYVEKPVSQCIREGRLMVEAARRNRRVVQVGLQQRSGSHFQRAVAAVRGGRIGRVHFAQCWNHNFSPARYVPLPPDGSPPAGLDWDLWLGPAPQVPYNPARRNFRVFWDYAGGELTNWCVHLLDVVHWATGLDSPLSVASSGGTFHLRDGRECPDTQEVIWEYPDCLVRYSTTAHNSFGPNGHAGNKPFGSYGILMHGTEGTIFIDRAGYEIVPQMKTHADRAAQSSRDAFDDLTGVGLYYSAETTGERGTTSFQHAPHVRNFLDCVKSRQTPAADIEIGHRSTVPCLLGNIALRTGRKLQWDAVAERITNDAAANAWLARRYRAPWKLRGLDN